MIAWLFATALAGAPEPVRLPMDGGEAGGRLTDRDRETTGWAYKYSGPMDVFVVPISAPGWVVVEVTGLDGKIEGWVDGQKTEAPGFRDVEVRHFEGWVGAPGEVEVRLATPNETGAYQVKVRLSSWSVVPPLEAGTKAGRYVLGERDRAKDGWYCKFARYAAPGPHASMTVEAEGAAARGVVGVWEPDGPRVVEERIGGVDGRRVGVSVPPTAGRTAALGACRETPGVIWIDRSDHERAQATAADPSANRPVSPYASLPNVQLGEAESQVTAQLRAEGYTVSSQTRIVTSQTEARFSVSLRKDHDFAMALLTVRHELAARSTLRLVDCDAACMVQLASADLSAERDDIAGLNVPLPNRTKQGWRDTHVETWKLKWRGADTEATFEAKPPSNGGATYILVVGVRPKS